MPLSLKGAGDCTVFLGLPQTGQLGPGAHAKHHRAIAAIQLEKNPSGR